MHNTIMALCGCSLEIGEDDMATGTNGLNTLKCKISNVVHITDGLKNHAFTDLQSNMGNKEGFCERAVLALTNEIGGWINVRNISQVEC